MNSSACLSMVSGTALVIATARKSFSLHVLTMKSATCSGLRPASLMRGELQKAHLKMQWE